MNLEESDSFARENEMNEKKKKTVLASIILCVILVVLLFALIGLIKYQDSLKLKVFLNGVQYEFSSKFFQEIDGKTYVNVKEASKLFKYSYTKGEYKKYNEDPNSCYVSNNIETIAMTANEDGFTKYLNPSEKKIMLGETEVKVKNPPGYSENFSTNEKIKMINEEIYIPFENVSEIFSVSVDTNTKNRIKMYTLDKLFASAIKNVSSLGGKYTSVNGDYENVRALLYGLVVVSNGEEFGVISSTTGQEIIGPKYSQMNFVQNSKEFLVNAENTVGLISKEGETIIPPTEYDEISLLDDKNGIYLVKKGKKYGVLNRKGEVVIYVEYDKIGLKDVEKYPAEEIKNGTLLFGTSIPVYKDSKYGLYSVDGKEELAAEYNGFGCNIDEKDDPSKQSVLLIPESVGIKGIVFGSDNGYGVYDINGSQMVLANVCSKIYSKTKLGETRYYFEYNDVEMDLADYLEQNNLQSIKKGLKEETVNTSTNSVSNTITTTNEVSENTNATEEVTNTEN